ncbi:MAG TPA: protein kinase [Acidimicrobiales bacterium]
MDAVDLGIAGLGPGTPIGRGGFGTVYKAEQPAFRRTVAVKVLDGQLDERAQRRFERECQAMGSLSDHPGIITIFDAGTTGAGAPYLMMAFQPGGSVADKLARDGALAWSEGLRIGVEVAEALAAAHRLEVLHRDVKPANILLSGYGHAQLGDFGIARVTGATQTRGDEVTASLLYAPPEILDGQPPAAASDVYSLGATLFEALAGQAAFAGGPDDSIAALLTRILTHPVPDLRPKGVPDPVARVVEAAMAQEPSGRPASATDLARDLAAAARDGGVALGGSGTPAPGPADEARQRTVDQASTVSQMPPPPVAGPALTPGGGAFVVTHVVPRKGLPAWTTPDPTYPAVASLDPGLGVQLVAWWGEWAHIRCHNGWEAWVNGRLLKPV